MYALGSDGLLHIMNQHSGGDISPAPKFIRPNALARGLVVIDNWAFVATTGNCGRTPNGIWAMDLGAPVRELSTQKWWSGNANIEGSAGFAFGTDGTIYAATGEGVNDPAAGEFGRTVVALDPRTLKLKDWFTPAGEAGFKTAPVFFNYKNKDYVAVAGQEGRIYLLDAASLGGANHQTPVSVTSPYSTGAAGKGTWGALATWQDADGTRWILAPVAGALTADAKFPATNGDARNGSIVAFKVVDQGGKPALQPAWVSCDLTAPAAPIIVNGVVFALSTGEYLPPANATPTAEQRAQRSTPAILYAFDPATGKDIWSSGKTITGFSSTGGLASNASKVFVSTHDGTLYAFGYLLNRD